MLIDQGPKVAELGTVVKTREQTDGARLAIFPLASSSRPLGLALAPSSVEAEGQRGLTHAVPTG